MNTEELLRFTLIRLLGRYLRKDNLRIRGLFQIMKIRLENNQSITKKMFESVLTFIEREHDFRRYNRKQIRHIFSHLIINEYSPKETRGTLESFLV